MTRPLLRSLVLVALCVVAPTLVGRADEPARGESPGERVRKYTREWTDDYYNFHKEVYEAYTATLKDEKGRDVVAEAWHGKATGYYKDASKSWEAVYRPRTARGSSRPGRRASGPGSPTSSTE